jgi:hypothetical protein
VLALAGVLAGCAGESGDATSEGGLPAGGLPADTSAAARAVDAWCAEREAEVTAAEIAALRSQGSRAHERIAARAATVDTAALTDLDDVYSVAAAGVREVLADDGAVTPLPLAGELDELERRLAALPEGSAARRWGGRLAAYRRSARYADGGAGAGLEHEDSERSTRERIELAMDASRSGLPACRTMAVEASPDRVVATIALAAAVASGADDVESLAEAVDEREPWLGAQPLPDRCAVPAIGDEGLQGPTVAAVGVWRSASGAIGVNVNDGLHGGTLAGAPGGDQWTPYDVDYAAGGWQRRDACTP